MRTTTATTRRTPITRTRVVAALVATLALALPTGISLTATASASSAAPAVTKVVKVHNAHAKRVQHKHGKAKHVRKAKVVRKAPAAPAVAPVGRTAEQQSYEDQVIYYINVQRRQGGLRPVTSAGCPETTSALWAGKLASTDGFYHQSMYTLLDKCHAHYAGETLGRGDISPETLVTMWMNSPPHHAVLMSPAPDRIGVGAVRNSSGEWVTAANFIKF
jgi:uncharacterized protein YkwD